MEISKIRIRDIPEEERPRERLIRNGPESLSNAELLGVILRTGSREENAVSLANQILSKYNIKQLSLTNVSTLTQVHGVGKAKAAQIAAVFELARRLETFVKPKRKICFTKDVCPYIPKMREQKKKNL